MLLFIWRSISPPFANRKSLVENQDIHAIEIYSGMIYSCKVINICHACVAKPDVQNQQSDFISVKHFNIELINLQIS